MKLIIGAKRSLFYPKNGVNVAGWNSLGAVSKLLSTCATVTGGPAVVNGLVWPRAAGGGADLPRDGHGSRRGVEGGVPGHLCLAEVFVR